MEAAPAAGTGKRLSYASPAFDLIINLFLALGQGDHCSNHPFPRSLAELPDFLGDQAVVSGEQLPGPCVAGTIDGARLKVLIREFDRFGIGVGIARDLAEDEIALSNRRENQGRPTL